jgi:hypothetical protein
MDSCERPEQRRGKEHAALRRLLQNLIETLRESLGAQEAESSLVAGVKQYILMPAIRQLYADMSPYIWIAGVSLTAVLLMLITTMAMMIMYVRQTP